jgi:hypothetical protein
MSRRASLRTLVDRVRSSKRQARAGSSAKPSASGTRRTRVAERQSTLAPRTVVVGTLCLVAAAALVMSRNSSVVNWVAEVDAKGNVQRLEQVDSFDPTQITTPDDTAAPQRLTPRATSLAPAPAPEVKRAAPASTANDFAPAPAAPAEAAPRMVTASLRSTEVAAEPSAPAPSAPPANEQASAAVPATITGCLEHDADTFWLKGVSGADAPKSRSWKSGFLRKKSSNVALVDKAGGSRLASYVGRRIETNGALIDREMHVKSLRVLGACD